jgi:type IV pilus assembly protein PilO
MAATGTAGFSLGRLPLPLRIASGGAFVVIIALVYWVIFYTEISAKIDSANRSSNELQFELARQQQAQAGYLVDRDELVMRQQRQRELNKVLPADTEAAAFLSSLQQVSNVSGVDLKGWKPEDEQAQPYYSKVPMRLELGGHFHQIAKFMYEVGRLDRIINIEDIELSDPKVVGDDVDLKAHCKATTFHALKPKLPGDTAGAPGAPPAPGAAPTAAATATATAAAAPNPADNPFAKGK